MHIYIFKHILTLKDNHRIITPRLNPLHVRKQNNNFFSGTYFLCGTGFFSPFFMVFLFLGLAKTPKLNDEVGEGSRMKNLGASFIS
jgi:hypothetical protein